MADADGATVDDGTVGEAEVGDDADAVGVGVGVDALGAGVGVEVDALGVGVGVEVDALGVGDVVLDCDGDGDGAEGGWVGDDVGAVEGGTV